MVGFCKDAVVTGICTREGCRLRHDVRWCDTCSIFLKPDQWEGHVGGNRHRRNRGGNITAVASPPVLATVASLSAVVNPPTASRAANSPVVSRRSVIASTRAVTHASAATSAPSVPPPPTVTSSSAVENRPTSANHPAVSHPYLTTIPQQPLVGLPGTKLLADGSSIRCDTCGIVLVNTAAYNAHKFGRSHQDNFARQLGATSVQRVAPTPRAAPSPITGNAAKSGSSASTSIAANSGYAVNPDIAISFGTIHSVSSTNFGAAVRFGNSISTWNASNAGIPTPPITYIRCAVCNQHIPEDTRDAHMQSARHMRRARAAATEDAMREAESDKHGVTVSGKDTGVDFGVVAVDSVSSHSTTITVQQTDSSGLVTLKAVRVSSPDGAETSFSVPKITQRQWVTHGHPLSIKVTLAPMHEGYHNANLELVFHDVPGKQLFTIVRRLKALIGSAEDHERLCPSTPYVYAHSRPPPAPAPRPEDIHPGRRPVTWSKVKWSTSLLEYKPPKALIDVAFTPGKIRQLKAYVAGTFNRDSYAQHFQVPLWIEEEQNTRDLALFSKFGETLTPAKEYYKLEIEGLVERRPSVIVGDTILVQHFESPDKKWYQGVVHRTLKKEVSLRFPGTFSIYKGNKFNIRFVLNRMPYRRYHQAVTGRVPHERLIFPCAVTVTDTTAHRPPSGPLVYFNRKIGQNQMQTEVVQGILAQPPGSEPFVIFGPPGTGKTVTIVEAIRQLLDRNPATRIIACAPSNSAADLITVRLIDIGRTCLFRLNALSRQPYRHESRGEDRALSFPPELRDFVLINEEGVFAIPPREELATFRVVVCTNVAAGAVAGLGLPRGHFNYIFADEAGQAHEPEVMVPIMGLADEYTNVVLSGDPQQLRPVLRSPIVRKLGLGKSYLERLIELADGLATGPGGSGGPSGGGAPRGKSISVVKLQDHYRSHPAIIKFSNDGFYAGELMPCADPAITESLLRWDGLPTPSFPIVFHGVAGKEAQESRSPSFFNPSEVSLVKQYAADLLSNRGLRLTPKDIGIISPYHAQCMKISSVMTGKLAGIKVGSVEEFQGQERRVIIISTVRSSLEHVELDLRHNLGFVTDARRFNVAITRAQALLIVVGNPVILSLDPLWRKFLNYVKLKGGWKGKEMDWDPYEAVRAGGYDELRRKKSQAAIESLLERTKRQVLEHVQAGDDNDDDVSVGDDWEGHLDKPFREIE